MNAQNLFEFLLAATQAGVDLSTLDVRVNYSYLTEGGFADGETSPSHVSIDNSELVLGPTPYTW